MERKTGIRCVILAFGKKLKRSCESILIHSLIILYIDLFSQSLPLSKAKQRADLEARLQKTTQKAPSAYSITPSIPSHILKNRTRLEEELRRDTIALQALVDRILTEENVHKSLKTQKRRLASFLVTKAPKDVGVRGRVIAPYVPGAIVPSPKSTSDPNSSSTRDSPTRTTARDKKEDDSDSKEKELSTKSTIPDPSTYALYFLPKKLTPSQEDLLDEQEDKCDAELDRMDSQVERKVNDLKNNLERIKNRVKGKKKELEEIRKMEKEIKDREKEKRLKEEAERRKERDERKDGDEDGEKRLDSDEKMESKEVKDRDDRENDQSRSRSGSRSRSLSRDSKREGSLDREGYAEVN